MPSSPIVALYPVLPEDIRTVMKRFDEEYLQSLSAGIPTVARALEHLQKSKGKQLRPAIVFLVARAFGADRDDTRWEDAMHGAIAIELLHLASLIHDDVIDESHTRRGVLSFYALLGAHKAVLIGDFILSHAFTHALLIDSQVLALTLADLGMRLAEGELLQEDISELSVTTEEQYFQVISRKTASLIKAAFRVGAEVAGVRDAGTVAKLTEAAEKIGLAFQIKDDIFDYLPTKELGKPAGNDLKEHKVTLPLIHAFSMGNSDAKKASKLLKKKELSSAEIRFLLDLAIQNGGIEYATKRMKDLVDDAKRLLREVLPAGEDRDALLAIADYSVLRDK